MASKITETVAPGYGGLLATYTKAVFFSR